MELATMDPVAQQELQRMTRAIEEYAARLDSLGAELETIEQQNRNDEVSRQIQQYNEATVAPQEIAAEDAMDNIVRLQNQLKIVQRRNQLLARENAMQEKLLRERANKLHSTHKELDMVMAATGWYGGKRDVQFSRIERERADIHDMSLVEASLRADIKSSKVTIARLEKTVLALSAKVLENEERRTRYMQLCNDCRVREKECNELQAKAQRMAADNNKLQLVVKTESDSNLVENSIACMESDREFLSDAVQDMKMACRRQENVIKAQITREQQLQRRLDTVTKSLNEMRLAREFERNVAKSALVPSASREEPEDVSEVLPQDEYIPVDTFRLLYKNNEMMRTNVARKNMLVLEKESVVQSMEARLMQHVEKHNEVARFDDSIHISGEASVRAAKRNLDAEENKLVRQIEELRASNNQMRAAIAKKAAPTQARKAASGRRK
ncbi:conserved hypothetical protein [Leishmania infantum JPCM5]|uniref:Uncharacterized protein n=2 Tax=Leishmania infantum TaxID=5671 RepID=A4IBR1_LEIIN|nr:conserved hypothetical protein [Leishmania infantum JPCM5]CAC9546223.1 hypothetical_protein_-_conserved [Leishmania infantum]CAM72282.1 conserved hypothetical protein [Leishmania infantum JPCM5]SUZ46201.1 hypothetical_protein_-_conserved [Leishmania infantum]|eukprot:XP_001469180.1 conserved hypothetical protein [Leishmania infantum JPCM5]